MRRELFWAILHDKPIYQLFLISGKLGHLPHFGPGRASPRANSKSQTRPKINRATYWLPKPAHRAIFCDPNPQFFGLGRAGPLMINSNIYIPCLSIILQAKEASSDNIANVIHLGQSSKLRALIQIDAPSKTYSSMDL